MIIDPLLFHSFFTALRCVPGPGGRRGLPAAPLAALAAPALGAAGWRAATDGSDTARERSNSPSAAAEFRSAPRSGARRPPSGVKIYSGETIKVGKSKHVFFVPIIGGLIIPTLMKQFVATKI